MGQLGAEVSDLLLGGWRRDWHTRFSAVAAIHGVVEERVEAIVFLLRDGIIFMRMALGAHHRESEPGRGGGGYAVLDGLGPIFLVVTAAFIVGFGIAIEAGR